MFHFLLSPNFVWLYGFFSFISPPPNENKYLHDFTTIPTQLMVKTKKIMERKAIEKNIKRNHLSSKINGMKKISIE